MFRDRLEAGFLLAAKLQKYKNTEAIILAVPRGGVPVAYVIAWELGLSMELVLTKKIGHPINEEYAIGAASLGDYFVIPHENVTEKYIQSQLVKIRNRLWEMQNKFMGDRAPATTEGKTIILVDDGIATGNTLLATVNVLQKSKPAKIVIATPVASESAFEKLSKEVDEVVAVTVPEIFHGVGAFYEYFEQVSDEEVLLYLNKLKNLKKAI